MDVQITIPQLYDGTTFYKLYVYCSRDMQYIDTISKIRTIHPCFIIDEATFDRNSQYFQNIDGQDCYVIPANILALDQDNYNIPGVSWFGSRLNIVPTSEYEMLIDVFKVNPYTYTSKVTLNNIFTSELGSMLYYSVIGVNTITNQITHLSKVSGVRIKFDLPANVRRELSSCDNYTGKDSDTWNVITVLNWDEPVVIGNLTDKTQYDKFGCPFVTTVPIFSKNDMSVSLKPLNTRGCVLLSFPNPWQGTNQAYNYRKLKSFRFTNITGGVKSDPSEPTFQSKLPLVLEKAYILIEEGAAETDSDIPIPYGIINAPESNITVKEIVRKDGIFYDAKKLRNLGFNKYIIPMNEPMAVFSEHSSQDKIDMEISVYPGNTYKITIYLVDVYENFSKPSTIYFNV